MQLTLSVVCQRLLVKMGVNTYVYTRVCIHMHTHTYWTCVYGCEWDSCTAKAIRQHVRRVESYARHAHDIGIDLCTSMCIGTIRHVYRYVY